MLSFWTRIKFCSLVKNAEVFSWVIKSKKANIFASYCYISSVKSHLAIKMKISNDKAIKLIFHDDIKPFTIQSQVLLRTMKKKTFENIVGKEENAGNQHFLLFPSCFLHYQRQKSANDLHLNFHLQLLSILICLKFCFVDKE